MIDPVNDLDGVACEHCGEEADRALMIVGRQAPVPLCGDCAHDETTTCDQCQRVIWQQEGRRLFSDARLYCATCAKPWLTCASTKALRRDEQRDEFNRSRR